ncbi:hypothetical protein SDC9_145492 [bioreactor metagenome]|uniref:Uncharacterized protein n=1 Tax=bioreactor metagenome TaxID=1076179 RepID=A0A645E8T7_9ZZZZ
MIGFWKYNGIKSLGVKIRRVAVNKGIWSIVLLDEGFKILVFNVDFREGTVKPPNICKEPAYITSFAAVGIPIGIKAVTEQLVVNGGSLDILFICIVKEQFSSLCCTWRREHDFREF